ncbi:MAG: hypothetical protein V4623_04605 [Pseudomonadota bacterium]
MSQPKITLPPIISVSLPKRDLLEPARYDTPTFKLPTSARVAAEQAREHARAAQASPGERKQPPSSLYAERAQAAQRYMEAKAKQDKQRKEAAERQAKREILQQEEGELPERLDHPESAETALENEQNEANAIELALPSVPDFVDAAQLAADAAEALFVAEQSTAFERIKEMTERLASALEKSATQESAGESAGGMPGDLLISLSHPLFEHTQLRIRLAPAKQDDASSAENTAAEVLVDCECSSANEADWFRARAAALSSLIGGRLQRVMKIRVHDGSAVHHEDGSLDA